MAKEKITKEDIKSMIQEILSETNQEEIIVEVEDTPVETPAEIDEIIEEVVTAPVEKDITEMTDQTDEINKLKSEIEKLKTENSKWKEEFNSTQIQNKPSPAKRAGWGKAE